MVDRSSYLKTKATLLPAALIAFVASVIGAVAFPGSAGAWTVDELLHRVETLENQLKEVKKDLDATKQVAKEAQKQAKEEDDTTIKWHFAGFGTANYTATDQPGVSNSFGAASFNPIFLVSYKDLLLFESELEISGTTDGETEVGLEFANLNLNATDWLTVTAGKFLSPLGDFQQHSHPSWINKLPDRPAGFTEDGGTEDLSKVGIMARGAVPIGSTTVDYSVFVANEPRLADSAEDGIELEGFGGDVTDDKAFGGRLGFRPLPYVNLGISAMHARIKGNEGAGGAVTSADYDMEVADAAFTKGNFDIRGEFIRAHLDSLMTAPEPTDMTEMIPASTWYAWYAQGAYRLAGITDNPILRNFEPVVRYSQFWVSGFDDFETNEEDRWTVGLDYWFAPSAVAKVAYESRDFHHQEDANVFRAQLAFGF
jgi:outer membrane murein-binding lipoprotein Lpp